MEQKQISNISRREILKVLAASGGALAAAAFLPVKWVKPLVQSGVLPAHAQSSRTLRITDSIRDCTEEFMYVRIYYQDDLGGVDSNASVRVTVEGCTGYAEFKLSEIAAPPLKRLAGGIPGSWSGDGDSGYIGLTISEWLSPFIICSGPPPSVCLTLIVGSRSVQMCFDICAESRILR